MQVVGVDVSKDTLMICLLGGNTFQIPNARQNIKSLLNKLSIGATVAMEATGNYHKLLAQMAYERGFLVYVFNPKDVLYYAKSISPRAKTDKVDAKVIALYAQARHHRPYQPPPESVEKIKGLTRTRATLVRQCVTLTAQMTEHPEIKAHLRKALESLKLSQKSLEAQISRLAADIPEYELLLKIKGFGELTAAYMAALLSSGEFLRSDSFVAHIGLDLRVSESGKRKGRRILSKRGDPEARRLLYLAAFSASQSDGPFKEMKLRHLAKGYSKTETFVYIARKLARIAWAIFTQKEEYRPERVLSQSGSYKQTGKEQSCSNEDRKAACVASLLATQADGRRVGVRLLFDDKPKTVTYSQTTRKKTA